MITSTQKVQNTKKLFVIVPRTKVLHVIFFFKDSPERHFFPLYLISVDTDYKRVERAGYDMHQRSPASQTCDIAIL